MPSRHRVGADGEVVECVGPLRLVLAPRVTADGGLHLEHRRCELSMGRGRWTLPAFLAPRVEARVEHVEARGRHVDGSAEPVVAGGIEVAVCIRLPWADPLLEYRGVVDLVPTDIPPQTDGRARP